jgi:hypothetical protein
VPSDGDIDSYDDEDRRCTLMSDSDGDVDGSEVIVMGVMVSGDSGDT